MENKFWNFYDRLEFDREVILDIKDKKKTIENIFIDHFGKEQMMAPVSLFIGSYGRNTAIFTNNIRLMVVLPGSLYLKLGLNEDAILETIVKLVREKFRFAFLDSDGIHINFVNELNYIIIPAFRFEHEIYNYYSNNKWKRLDLLIEKTNFNELNSKSENNLVFLCRVMKRWKNVHEVEISNILLDTWCYHFIKNLISNEHDFRKQEAGLLIQDFFKFMLRNCEKNNYVSFDGMKILRRKFPVKDAVLESSINVDTAIMNEKIGDGNTANVYWSKVFGSLFLR